MKNSYFDGGLLSYVVNSLVSFAIIVFTFGFGTPWAIVYMQNWKTSHTVIDGKRLYFDGTGMQLFGNWVKWFLLTIITFGIYGFWVHLKVQQWITMHTHHID